MLYSFMYRGGVSERFKEAVLKTVESLTGSVGSNPTPSASQKLERWPSRSKAVAC